MKATKPCLALCVLGRFQKSIYVVNFSLNMSQIPCRVLADMLLFFPVALQSLKDLGRLTYEVS
jgi:hypothetical protein